MGEAKKRGTFKHRQELAIERDRKIKDAVAEVQKRKASPRHIAFMAILAATMKGQP